ncbi:SLAP domain-containing protein [Companilactobacillus muriivasis]|uniref:SLAP domain-containing protein n=1 Tax=Companilactobacillus muriivasis TaxID=3081444 RepID=UPI0030C6BD7C
MSSNKKYVYLGATLFSAVLLTSLSNQTVRAATTADTSTSSTTSEASPSTATTALKSVTTATPAVNTTTSSTSTAPTTVTTTTTAPVTVASTSTTATAPTSTTTASTTTKTSSTITTTTGIAATPSTTTTTATASTGSTTGVTFPSSSIPTTTPTGTGTTTTGTTTPTLPATGTNDYSIPANITNDTVVNFADPTLAALVKKGLGLKPTDNITVGDIKGYKNAVTLEVDEETYMAFNPATAQLLEPQFTPIESLDGIQYLKLLPSDMIDFRVRLGSDAKANPDLTPLDGIKFNGLMLIGNFSNPNAKEINVDQITKLEVPTTTGGVDFYGDQDYNGINNAELKTLAPWIIAYSNNGQQYDGLILNGNSITDYSPLKDINRTANFNLNVTGGSYNSTPIYAVKGQPIKFTAKPFTGLDGEDLASNYNFSTSVPAGTAKIYNLKSLGNDKYELDGADPTESILTYGNAGLNANYNPTSSLDGITFKHYGKSVFLSNFINGQPIIWQDHPNVTINYVDSTGKSLMTKTVNGTNIGDAFDLTGDTAVAGYKLTSPTTGLKGEYTQDPQVITLTYAKIPKKPSSSSSSSTPAKKPAPIKVPDKTADGEKVIFYYIPDNPIGVEAALAHIGVKATATIHGKPFYLLGSGEVVAASDYDFVKETTSGIVRTFGTAVTPVNAYGEPLTRSLLANTEWKYSNIVTIKGASYYQVATDEFIPVAKSLAFTPAAKPTVVHVTEKTLIYDSQGKSTGQTLPSGSAWKTDGSAVINGVTMYRVSTDGWVSEKVSTTYQPVKTVYKAETETTVYNSTGKVISKKLPIGSSWKADRIVTIDGQEYLRIATNEFVKYPA